MDFLGTAVPFTLAFGQFFHLSSKLAFDLRQAFNGPSPVFRWPLDGIIIRRCAVLKCSYATGIRDCKAHNFPEVCLICCQSVCCQEPSVCEKEALPASESSLRLLSSLDNLSSDVESHPTEEPALLPPQQGFRRRANTLSHVPLECQQTPEQPQKSPGVSQRKLMRYHSVSTETPHERK